MDACDPDVKTKNIRKLIRIHTGRDLNISKERMCEISTDIAKGNLPLPPLVLTRDKRYLLDSKSPLSRQDYESLYKSRLTSRVVKRIAKKVGLVDVKKTIVELKYAIGRRLKSLKVREPVLLPGSRILKKMRYNNDENPIDNINNNINTRTNEQYSENNPEEETRHSDHDQQPRDLQLRGSSPMTNNKMRNIITQRRQKQRTLRLLGGKNETRSNTSNKGINDSRNDRNDIRNQRMENVKRDADKRVKNARLAAQRQVSESRVINGRRKKDNTM